MILFKIFIVAVFAMITSLSLHAQSDKMERNSHTKTEKVKVYGECGMCKKRIENAALSVGGVQAVTWNEDNKMLTLKYDVFAKNAVDSVQKQIATAGHDTEKYAAGDAAYQQLLSVAVMEESNRKHRSGIGKIDLFQRLIFFQITVILFIQKIFTNENVFVFYSIHFFACSKCHK